MNHFSTIEYVILVEDRDNYIILDCSSTTVLIVPYKLSLPPIPYQGLMLIPGIELRPTIKLANTLRRTLPIRTGISFCPGELEAER